MNTTGSVVLAFSGGLDTSFCVPYLLEQGYDVIALYVHTSGPSGAECEAIRARALELGATEFVAVDASDALWDSVVTPLVQGGARYQGQYPALCSDRYLIVAESVKLAHERGGVAIAHGCTAMGNDQVRFDQSLRCLTTLPILAPIREIQSVTDSPREYEKAYLRDRGFSVASDVSRYTINENLLGATVSGSEIDEFLAPSDESRRLTKSRRSWPAEPLRVEIGFEQGVATTLDGVPVEGPALLANLNSAFGAYGVGRHIYTGDTIVGLKGRIVFECPGIDALLTAHQALEEVALTQPQNSFKASVAQRWVDLVFEGLYFDPLREDIEAFLRSTQRNVTGVVTVESDGGVCTSVGVRTDKALLSDDGVYAQRAAWSAADAEGFIRLYGQSSRIAAQRSVVESNPEAALCSSVS